MLQVTGYEIQVLGCKMIVSLYN